MAWTDIFSQGHSDAVVRSDCRGWGKKQGIQLGGFAVIQGIRDGGSDQGGRNLRCF